MHYFIRASNASHFITVCIINYCSVRNALLHCVMFNLVCITLLQCELLYNSVGCFITVL